MLSLTYYLLYYLFSLEEGNQVHLSGCSLLGDQNSRKKVFVTDSMSKHKIISFLFILLPRSSNELS